MAEPPDPVYVFHGDMGNILSLVPISSSASDFLLVGTTEGFVHIWDLKTKRETKKISVGQGPCSSILEIPDGYATLEKGDAIRLWTQDWKLIQTIPVDFAAFCNLDYNGQLLVPDYDGIIRVVNTKAPATPKLHYEQNKKVGEVICIKYVKSVDVIIACYEKGLLTVWNVNGQICNEAEIEDTPMCMAFCEKTSQLFVGTSGKVLSKFSLIDKALVLDRQVEITNPGISGVSVRSDGKLCAISCWDHKIRYFSVKTLKLLAVLDHKGSLNCLSFSPNNPNFTSTGHVFVGGNDGRVTIWNLYHDK